MVVSVAGSLDHDTVVKLVRKAFAPVLDDSAEIAPVRKGGNSRKSATGIRIVARPTEQAHLVMGMPGLARGDKRRYAMSVLSTAFGGGMSSRLFQEIREKRGMAYSVYSYAQSYADNGMFGIYVGCLPGKVESVLQVCRDELNSLVATGLTDDEIARAKGQVRGATVLGQEDTGARMTRIAKSELHQEPLLSIGQLLERVDAVTGDDIRNLAREVLDTEPSLAVIGPFRESTRFSAMA
jgi:predicted Zn-dependent peptidase